MPRLSQWNLRRQNNYSFIDFHVSQFYNVSGTALYVHKYIGPLLASGNDSSTQLPGDKTQVNAAASNVTVNELTIQDVFNQENRSRKYDDSIFEMRGHYTISDNDFDLSSFGFFLSADTIHLTLHLNDMVKIMGRKIISGDVIELPHQREEYSLDPSQPAINKYFVVQDAARAATGYSPQWWPHIWRLKLTPMQNQQEFFDIILKEGIDQFGNKTSPKKTLEDIISTHKIDIDISNAIVAEASRQVPKRFWDCKNFYLLEPTDCKGRFELAYFDGDGEPPNGLPFGDGTSFPPAPNDLDFFLRTDYIPNVLFQRQGTCWVKIEVNWRGTWEAANDKLLTFLNNNDTFISDSQKIKSKQAISKIFKPKADF